MRIIFATAFCSTVVSSAAPRHRNALSYHVSDPCRRLCEEFTASTRGNGYNLCDEAPGTSSCTFDELSRVEICSHIYWSTTEDNQSGVVYEVHNPTSASDLRPLTCQEAEQIVFGPTEPTTVQPSYSGENTSFFQQGFRSLHRVLRFLDS
jgi:hypothetical protein